jgi:RHS repeat-associated protein
MNAIKQLILGVGIALSSLWLPFLVVGMAGTSAPVLASDFGNPPGPPPGPPDPPPCTDDCCENPGGGSPGGGGPSGSGGQPVSLFNGRETVTETDLEVPGLYGISITRKYRSDNTYDSPLGYGWALNYDQRLYEYPDGSIRIRYDCGLRDRYVKTGNTYVSDYRGRKGELTALGGGGYRFQHRNGTREYYDFEGKLFLLQNKEGHSLELTYDARGKLPLVGTSPNAVDPTQPLVVAYHHRLTRIEERSASGTLTGRYVTFQYNETTGRLRKVVASDGRSVTYEHQTAATNLTTGNLTKVVGLENYVQTYKYEDPNDPVKHRLTWFQKGSNTHPYVNEYDTQGRVIKQTHGDDVHTFAYNQGGIDGTVTRTIVDNSGPQPVITQTKTDYWFDENARVEKMQDALGNVTQYTRNTRNQYTAINYWESGRPLNNPPNRTETFDYDSQGNQTTQKVTLEDGATHTKKRTYKNGWLASERTLISGLESESERTNYIFNYDSDGQAVNVKEMHRYVGTDTYLITRYEYDSQNRLTRTTYPDGAVQVYTYNAGSLSVNQIHWELNGQVSPYQLTTFAYNSRGLLASQTTAGQTTYFTYDNRNRIKMIRNALDQFSDYYYQNLNLVRTVEGRAAGSMAVVTQYVYDGYNRLERVERRNESGAYVNYNTRVHDTAGRLLRVTDAENKTLTYTYDGLDRRTSQTDSAGNQTEYRYDLFGNLRERKDAKDRITQYRHDDADRLTEIQQTGISPNALTRYGYDGADRLETVTDPEGNTTTYRYDRLGRRTHIIQPLGQTEDYTYDDRDRVKTYTNVRGHHTVYDYYGWGPVDTIRYFNNAQASTPFRTVRFTYHSHGGVASVEDSAVKTGALYSYTYDSLFRPLTETLHYLPGDPLVLQYDYTGRGELLTLDLVKGSDVRNQRFDYDRFGRTRAVEWGPGNRLALGFYGNDDLQTLSWPGANQNRTYYPHGPLQNLRSTGNGGTLLELAYTYDAVLNIDTITQNSQLQDFGYDGLDRLTDVTRPSGLGLPTSENYDYDLVGNREAPADAETYEYDNNNRLLQGPVGAYQYDADGNLSNRGDGAQFTHNEDSRLVGYQKGSTNASYLYDPYGRRIRKTVNGQNTWFVWNGSDLLAEYNGSGQLQRRYGAVDGQPVALLEEQAGSAPPVAPLGTSVVGSSTSVLSLYDRASNSVAPNGDRATVWIESVGSQAKLNLRRYDADTQSWSATEVIATETTGMMAPRLAQNSAGDLFLVYQSASGAGLYARYYRAATATWSARKELASNYHFAHLAALDENGYATVVWSTNQYGPCDSGVSCNRYRGFSSRYHPTTLSNWSEPQTLFSENSYPETGGTWVTSELHQDANNNLWLLAVRANGLEYAFQIHRLVNGQFTQVRGASTAQGGYYYDLAGDRQGNLMLAYFDEATTPHAVKIEHYRSSTGTWQQHALTPAAEPVWEIAVSMANGKALLKYKNNAYGQVPEGSFLQRFDGNQWQAVDRISDHSVQAELADNGDILLLESRYSHSGTVSGQTVYYTDLYTRRYTEAAGWSGLVKMAEGVVEAHTDIVAGANSLSLSWWGFQQPIQTSTFDATTNLPGTKMLAVHTDHLGAPRLLTDRTGTKVWEAQYEAFGKAVVNGNPDGDAVTISYPIRFPGQYYDAESGLHQNYFRDYDPSIGRYVTRDPIGLVGGLNVYVYVSGNPLKFVDKLGWIGKTPKRNMGTRECTGPEYRECEQMCGSRGVESCAITQQFRTDRFKNPLERKPWVDGPMSCSCNEPEEEEEEEEDESEQQETICDGNCQPTWIATFVAGIGMVWAFVCAAAL